MKLLDHLGNDARCAFIFASFHQRDEFIACRVFHQLSTLVVVK